MQKVHSALMDVRALLATDGVRAVLILMDAIEQERISKIAECAPDKLILLQRDLQQINAMKRAMTSKSTESPVVD